MVNGSDEATAGWGGGDPIMRCKSPIPYRSVPVGGLEKQQ